MILFSHYFNLALFSKLTLPIELSYHLKNSDEVIASGDANDDCEILMMTPLIAVLQISFKMPRACSMSRRRFMKW